MDKFTENFSVYNDADQIIMSAIPLMKQKNSRNG